MFSSKLGYFPPWEFTATKECLFLSRPTFLGRRMMCFQVVCGFLWLPQFSQKVLSRRKESHYPEAAMLSQWLGIIRIYSKNQILKKKMHPQRAGGWWKERGEKGRGVRKKCIVQQKTIQNNKIKCIPRIQWSLKWDSAGGACCRVSFCMWFSTWAVPVPAQAEVFGPGRGRQLRCR